MPSSTSNGTSNLNKSSAFRPFEAALDRDDALKTLRAATHGADDGELFLERRRAEVLSFDDGRLRTASYDASEGFGLRAVRGEAGAQADIVSGEDGRKALHLADRIAAAIEKMNRFPVQEKLRRQIGISSVRGS